MEKTEKMFLTVLKAKYDRVRTLGHGLYLVYRANRFGWWGIYSSKNKDIVCSGDKHKILSPDLISFESMITWSGGGSHTEESLFSIQKKRKVAFGDYSGYSFELCDRCWVKGLFLKTIKTSGNIHIVGGLGIFDVSKEDFVIQPEYDELISLGDNQYYGTRKDRRTRKEAYFLISIDRKGIATTQKTSKIA